MPADISINLMRIWNPEPGNVVLAWYARLGNVAPSLRSFENTVAPDLPQMASSMWANVCCSNWRWPSCNLMNHAVALHSAHHTADDAIGHRDRSSPPGHSMRDTNGCRSQSHLRDHTHPLLARAHTVHSALHAAAHELVTQRRGHAWQAMPRVIATALTKHISEIRAKSFVRRHDPTRHTGMGIVPGWQQHGSSYCLCDLPGPRCTFCSTFGPALDQRYLVVSSGAK